MRHSSRRRAGRPQTTTGAFDSGATGGPLKCPQRHRHRLAVEQTRLPCSGGVVRSHRFPPCCLQTLRFGHGALPAPSPRLAAAGTGECPRGYDRGVVPLQGADQLRPSASGMSAIPRRWQRPPRPRRPRHRSRRRQGLQLQMPTTLPRPSRRRDELRATRPPSRSDPSQSRRRRFRDHAAPAPQGFSLRAPRGIWKLGSEHSAHEAPVIGSVPCVARSLGALEI